MGLLPILAQYFSTGADLEIAFQMQVEICEFRSIVSILHKQSFAVGAFALCLSHTSCTIRFFIWELLLGVLSSVPTFGEVKIAWYCHVPIMFFLYLFSFNWFSPFSMSVEHCLSSESISFLSRLQEPKVWCVLCCPPLSSSLPSFVGKQWIPVLHGFSLMSDIGHAAVVVSHLRAVHVTRAHGSPSCPLFIFHEARVQPWWYGCVYIISPCYDQRVSQPWISVKFMIGPRLPSPSRLAERMRSWKLSCREISKQKYWLNWWMNE